jgi:energy-coupling factor transporter ATP-binding protein EcfA2
MASEVLPIEESRHVVLLGKSGAGKSTVGNHLTGIPGGFKTGSALRGVTDSISHMDVVRGYEGRRLKINVTDTIGLFDIKKRNREIMRKIRTNFRDYCTTGLNVILFVFKKARFTVEEGRVFDLILNYCSEEASKMSALVITDCEAMGAGKRAQYVEDFKSDELTRRIANFMQLGIYPVGFPDIDSDSYMSEALQEAFRSGIEEDTQTLLKLLADNPQKRMGKQIFDDKWWDYCPLF